MFSSLCKVHASIRRCAQMRNRGQRYIFYEAIKRGARENCCTVDDQRRVNTFSFVFSTCRDVYFSFPSGWGGIWLLCVLDVCIIRYNPPARCVRWRSRRECIFPLVLRLMYVTFTIIVILPLIYFTL